MSTDLSVVHLILCLGNVSLPRCLRTWEGFSFITARVDANWTQAELQLSEMSPSWHDHVFAHTVAIEDEVKLCNMCPQMSKVNQAQ